MKKHWFELGTIKDIEDYDIETLLAMAERRAIKRYDGQLSIYRFTTGWSVCFRIPSESEIRKLETFFDLKSALLDLLDLLEHRV